RPRDLVDQLPIRAVDRVQLARRLAHLRDRLWRRVHPAGEIAQREAALVDREMCERLAMHAGARLAAQCIDRGPEARRDFPYDRLQRRADEPPLRLRMLSAADLLANQRLHPLAEFVAAEEDLTAEGGPGVVRDAACRGHELAIGDSCVVVIARVELVEGPARLEPRRRRGVPARCVIVAPWILRRRDDGAAAHGIQHEIADQFEKMPFLLDEDALEPALEQMAESRVTPVEVIDVGL